MIPANVVASLSAFQASVVAAAPLATVTSLQKSALLKQGNAVLATIDAALVAAAGSLDSADATGLPTVMVVALLGLSTASDDQADLANLRGLVGRAVFNLAQAGN